MRRNSKSKKRSPASFVIGEEAIVDDAFRTEQPSGSNLKEETGEDHLEPATPGGGAETPAAPRQRSSEGGEESRRRTTSPGEGPARNAFTDDDDEEELSERSSHDAPAETDEFPPAPVSHRAALTESSGEELTYPSSRSPLTPVKEGRELAATEHGGRTGSSVRSSRRLRERGGSLAALLSLRRSEAAADPVEPGAKNEERSERPRLDERERRGVAAAGAVALLVAALALSGALKGGGDEDQGADSGRGERLAQLQDKRDERRAERRQDRRAAQIAERRHQRLAARRQKRQEARAASEVEQVEAPPAPIETAPATVPVPAPAPAPVPAQAPTGGDNIAGNEWGP